MATDDPMGYIPWWPFLVIFFWYPTKASLQLIWRSGNRRWMDTRALIQYIKISSYQYRKSHCGDKTVVRSSYLHNGISFTGKMSSLYWIGTHDDIMSSDSFNMDLLLFGVKFLVYVAFCGMFTTFSGLQSCAQSYRISEWLFMRLPSWGPILNV